MRRLWLETLGVLCFALLACAPPAAKPPQTRAIAPAPLAKALPISDWVRPPQAPPFQLTASDGTGLTLSAVTASTSIEDPLALTELHMVFQHVGSGVLEGRFTFTLPEGAALSRFAMKVNDKWQEAEVVEKQRARVSYEDFVHRRVDPALLERGAGNEVSVRVFPIMGGEKKEIIVAYSETLTQDAPYRIHLAGLPLVTKLKTSVHADGELLQFEEAEKSVPADVVIPAARWSQGDAVALRAGSNVVARVRVPESEASAEPIESLIALVDTSASHAADLGDEIASLGQLAAALAPETPLVVGTFDQSVELVFNGKAGELGEPTFRSIRARKALGASNVAQALAWAATIAKSRPAATHRLLLIGDGVATAGEDAIAGSLKLVRASGIARADALVFGAIRDSAALESIVKGKLDKSGVVVDSAAGKDAIVRKLTHSVSAPIAVAVPGAAWWFPRTVEAQPGDEVTVFAKVATERAKVQVKLGEATLSPQTEKGSRPFVERAVAEAQVREINEDDVASEKDRRNAIALSLRHRIVGRDTAMLVLERDADYERFNISRRAKVDVLAVVDGRIATLSHARNTPGGAAPGAAVDSQLVETEESKKLAGAKGSTHRSKAPTVRMCATSVSGRLPPESVKRTVRASFGKLRGCYMKGLEKHPGLEGRVAVRFIIGRDGAVSAVHIEESTLASAIAESCIAKTFAAMQFTPPEGGIIDVLYPLSLYPDGDTTPTPTTLALRHYPKYTPWEYQPPAPPREPSAYSGRFATVMGHIADDDLEAATTAVETWRSEAPTDVMSLLALGEVAEAAHDKQLAARAYGSILELWSYRADMRRLAGERLERVGTESALALAAEAYAGALADRPDHPSSHRLYAMALLKLGKPKQAFEVLEKALGRSFLRERFPGVRDVLRADLSIAGAAWAAKEPTSTEGIRARLLEHDLSIDKAPSTRFVMVWETDTSDVDLQVVDANGKEQRYGRPAAIENGSLGSNITDGYGPEQFVATGAESELAFPFEIKARYTSRGQAGRYAMGKVEVLRHDGAGKLEFEQRPFVLMENGATLSLGNVEKRGSDRVASK